MCFLAGSLMLGATTSGARSNSVSVPPLPEELSEQGKRDWKTGVDLLETCMYTHETATWPFCRTFLHFLLIFFSAEGCLQKSFSSGPVTIIRIETGISKVLGMSCPCSFCLNSTVSCHQTRWAPAVRRSVYVTVRVVSISLQAPPLTAFE